MMPFFNTLGISLERATHGTLIIAPVALRLIADKVIDYGNRFDQKTHANPSNLNVSMIDCT